MSKPNKVVALIPARSGSKRIKSKNIRPLAGIPLIGHTIITALESKLFSEVIVSTDSQQISDIALRFGAAAPRLRPEEIASDSSPDIDWVMHAIENMIETPVSEIEFLAILRPTSPLRTVKTMSHAINTLRANPWADSLRAMEVTDKHPGKMWIVQDSLEAVPYLNQDNELVPTHSRPTQSLQRLWVQNASLEITKLSSVLSTNSISGQRVLSFEMPEHEGFDLNSEIDWLVLEQLFKKLNPESN
jgi:CMP-N-acetylneuraminic acid synthetase